LLIVSPIGSANSLLCQETAKNAKPLEGLARKVSLLNRKAFLASSFTDDYGIPEGESFVFSFPYGEKRAARGVVVVPRRKENRVDIFFVHVLDEGGAYYFYVSADGKLVRAYFVHKTRDLLGEEANKLFEKELAFWQKWDKDPNLPCKLRKVDESKSLITVMPIRGDKPVYEFKLKAGVKVVNSMNDLKDERLIEGCPIVLRFDPRDMAVSEIRVAKNGK
jgi:hypothetical protein